MGRIQTRWGRATGPIGLDLGHHSIKLARLESDRQGRRVSAVARKATPPGLFDSTGCLTDPELLSAVLRQLTDELGLAGEDVIASVSDPSVRVELLTLAAAPGEDLVPKARFALRDRLPYDDIALTVHPLGFDGPSTAEPGVTTGVNVLVCAMPQALLDGVVKAIDGAGLAPLVIEASPLAASRLAVEPLSDSGVLLGDLGASHATWTLVRGSGIERVLTTSAGSDGLTAALAAAGGLEYLEAERHKTADLSALSPLDGDEVPDWTAQLDPYLQQLVDGIAAFALPAAVEPPEGDFEHVADPLPDWPFELIRLHGAAMQMPGLAARLQALVGVPVEPLDGFVRLGLQGEGWLPEAVWQEAPAFVNALALAWRAWVVED